MRRDEILKALTASGAELAERGLVADIYMSSAELPFRAGKLD
ncbi:MAG: hypothetical protein ACRDTC_26365 [Pseudonocardiaceae bacterium]